MSERTVEFTHGRFESVDGVYPVRQRVIGSGDAARLGRTRSGCGSYGRIRSGMGMRGVLGILKGV